MATIDDLKKFTYVNCICCGYKIELLDLKSFTDFKEYFDHYKTQTQGYNPDSQMWKGGIVHKISAGYGSDHDTDMFYIGVCDECTTTNIENGRLRYGGNYMSGQSVLTDKELSDLEQKRNRENNLNDLLD